MLILNLLFLNFIILSVYSIPLQYPVLNSKLICTEYSCDKCDNF